MSGVSVDERTWERRERCVKMEGVVGAIQGVMAVRKRRGESACES